MEKERETKRGDHWNTHRMQINGIKKQQGSYCIRSPNRPETSGPGVWIKKMMQSLQRVKHELPSRVSFQHITCDKRSPSPILCNRTVEVKGFL